MANFIVLRESPDWATFDLEQTRPFLRSHNLDEDLVIAFARIWDATFRLDYCTVRARLKALTMDMVHAVRGATLLTFEAFDPGAVTAGDRIVFQDDDDWPSPLLFETLDLSPHADGYRWGSLRIGLDFDVTARGAGILSQRPISPFVYTNNYAVDGVALNRLGVDAFFDHGPANGAFGSAGFVVADRTEYLSCAVKHPCSTVAIKAALSDPKFLRDPAGFIAPLIKGLDDAQPSGPAAWTAAPVAALRGILHAL